MALQTDTPALPPLIRIVDDNDTLRQSLEFMLQCEGYEVVSYASAMEFLKSDTPSRPGCLILDIQMPEMNGRDAARAIRKLDHKDAKTIPIFALSADAFVEDQRLSIASGMNGHFSKPIDFEKIRKEIGRTLKEKK